MNMAENIADSGPVESHHPRGASLVQTKVKPLAFKKRKNVMEKRIVIGKLHHRPPRNPQDVRPYNPGLFPPPAGTTRMCGSKLLFFCTSRGFAAELGVAVVASPPAPVVVIGVSHTTVPGIAPCRVLPALPAPMTSTRPRTVVVVTCVVACECNPAAPAHNI